MEPQREMYEEINALVGAAAKALGTSEMEVITAIEQGRLGMEMSVDEDGRNFVLVTCEDKTARIYNGAIFRTGDSPDKPRPDLPEMEAEAKDGEGCGCSCGH